MKSAKQLSRRDWLAQCGASCLALAGTGFLVRANCAEDSDDKPAADSWPLFRGRPTCEGVAASEVADKPQVVWRRQFPGSSFDATATIVDGTIYVGTLLGGDFYALDLATGEDKWKHHTELGFSAAAAVRDGVVYVGDTEGALFAFDAVHGDVKWSVSVDNEIHGVNFFEDQLLFTCEDGKLYCVDTDDGSKRWDYSIDNLLRCAPCVSGGHAFLAGCDSRLHVVDLSDGSAFGQIDIQDATLSTPAALGDMVYFGTQGSRFCGLNWREKRIDWNFEPKNKGQQVKSSAAVADGLVVFGGKDRQIYALDVKKGNEVWKKEVKAPMDSSPVVAGTRVFIGTERGQLVSVDLKTGENLWQYEAGGRFYASPAVAEGKLVIGNDAGDLYCFGK
jgi:outer membrane protein assembly factor BamB